MPINTKVLMMNDLNAISNCIAVLDEGLPIVFPTETVYGLACSAKDQNFKEKIYDLKGRDTNKPLALMVSGINELKAFQIQHDEALRVVMGKYWPGPLTIVFPIDGADAIGVRIPDHPFVLKLLQTYGPLFVTSANISQHKDAVNCQQALDYFSGKVKLVIDGGECKIGQPSTVIKASNPIQVIRVGSLTTEILEAYQKAQIKTTWN